MKKVEDWMWRIFLLWTAVGLVVMPWNPSAETIRVLIEDPFWQGIVVGLLNTADAVWIFLAAAVVYLHTAQVAGVMTARIWALIIMVISGAVEWVGHETGVPFGPYTYTERFGPRLGGVLPVAIPLAWLVVVGGAFLACRHWAHHWPRWGRCLLVATAALLTDINLEPVAWHIRGYWIWYDGWLTPPAIPPYENFATWFGLAFLLAYLMELIRPLAGPWRAPKRPWMIFLLVNGMMLWTHGMWHLLGKLG